MMNVTRNDVCAFLGVCSLSVAGLMQVAHADNVRIVSDVGQLTAAMEEGTGNFTKIFLKPGVYDVTDVRMAPNAHLLFNSWNGEIAGMGSTPEETVILAGGPDREDGSRRILTLNRPTPVVSNLTFSGGYYAKGSGGAIGNETSTRYVDCVFSNNHAGGFSGAVDCPQSLLRCKFIGNSSKGDGGAIRASKTERVEDCLFKGNAGARGGAVYYGTTFINTRFESNKARSGCGGAALHVPGVGTSAFVDCEFIGNTARDDGNAVYGCDAMTNCVLNANGGGRYVVFNCPSVYNCKFEGNSLPQPVLGDCIVFNSYIRHNEGVGANSLPMLKDSLFVNCLVADNVTLKHGCSSIASSSSFLNCTVVSNYYLNVQSAGTLDSACMAVNTILSGNVPSDIAQIPVTMTNCLWQTQSVNPGEKAIDCFAQAAPCFSDAAVGDYSLLRKSPARNHGYSDPGYLAFVGSKDLNFQPRVKFTSIDMGCFEFQLDSPATLMLFR